MDGALSAPSDAPGQAAGPLPPGIHLAQRLAYAETKQVDRNPFRGYALDLIPEWVIGACLAASLVVGVLLRGRLPPASISVLSVVCVCIFVMVCVRWAAGPSRIRSDLPYESDPAARLRIVANGWMIDNIGPRIREAHARSGTDWAGPEVFRISFAGESAGTLWARGIACFAAACVLILLVLRIGGIGNPGGIIIFFAALAVARVLWGFLWPVTVRIVPRRIDIIRHGLLGSQRRVAIESYDLTTSRLLIDLRAGRLFLQHDAADPGQWLSGVVGAPVRGGREMGMAVLNAALSRYEAPIGPMEGD